MGTKLSKIAISHISLVKAGANGKQIIYKSADQEPTYTKEIEIKKSDEERGVVYGIVYSPEEVDSQGDMASSDEIQRAAYLFMKSRNTLNVDKNHDFENVDAYVAESWLVRKDDAVFPKEKEGSWAVAVQLESDELKEAVKKGDIAGLSMAGVAEREETGEKTQKGLAEAIAKAFKEIFTKEEKKTVDEKEIEKSLEPLQKAFEDVKKENTELKKQNEALAKRVTEVEETLKKSKQNETPPSGDENKNTGGFL